MRASNSYHQPRNDWKLDFFSGLLGGMISVITLAPFDVARTRMAVMQTTKYGKDRYSGFSGTFKKIFADEGWKGLFKGVRVTFIANSLYHSIWFSLYGKFKGFARNSLEIKDEKYLVPMFASIASAWICEFVTTPFWMLRTRIQSHFLHTLKKDDGNLETMFSHFRKIYIKDGIRGFYRGLTPSLLALAHLGIYAPMYENLKEKLFNYSGQFKVWHILLSSMISKATSVPFIYPLIVVRARLQDNRNKVVFHRVINENEEVNFRSVCRILWRNEGFLGFYSGIRFDLTRIVLTNAIIFMVFEGVKYEFLEGFLSSSFEE